jgi:hypothetical protein
MCSGRVDSLGKDTKYQRPFFRDQTNDPIYGSFQPIPLTYFEIVEYTLKWLTIQKTSCQYYQIPRKQM